MTTILFTLLCFSIIFLLFRREAIKNKKYIDSLKKQQEEDELLHADDNCYRNKYYTNED